MLSIKLQAYLQNHVTPTQMMIIQAIDDTPVMATRITTEHQNITKASKNNSKQTIM